MGVKTPEVYILAHVTALVKTLYSYLCVGY